jgi:UDP-GlcNAc:undecaprenyl-phosphate GlcNAc-1-phosphate transferase
VALLSIIVAGSAVGFLSLNYPPAKIFMGDSGALLLGLLMSTSALTVTGQVDPTVTTRATLVPAFIPLILPLVILVLPLLDFTLAVLRRLQAGKSPFTADRKHIHHRLQDFGHSHLGSVLVFYAWTSLISVSCLLLFFLEAWVVVAIAFLGLIAALIFTAWPVLKRSSRFSRINPVADNPKAGSHG